MFFAFLVELACDAWLNQQMHDKHSCMNQQMKVERCRNMQSETPALKILQAQLIHMYMFKRILTFVNASSTSQSPSFKYGPSINKHIWAHPSKSRPTKD